MNIAIHGEKELLMMMFKELVQHGFDGTFPNMDDRWEYSIGIQDNHVALLQFLWGGLENTYHLTATNYTEILNKTIEKK